MYSLLLAQVALIVHDIWAHFRLVATARLLAGCSRVWKANLQLWRGSGRAVHLMDESNVCGADHMTWWTVRQIWCRRGGWRTLWDNIVSYILRFCLWWPILQPILEQWHMREIGVDLALMLLALSVLRLTMVVLWWRLHSWCWRHFGMWMEDNWRLVGLELRIGDKVRQRSVLTEDAIVGIDGMTGAIVGGSTGGGWGARAILTVYRYPVFQVEPALITVVTSSASGIRHRRANERC